MMTKKALSSRLKSKTYRLGLIIILLSFAQTNFPMIADYLGQYQGAVNFTIGALILIMRELTSTSLKSRAE